MKYYPLNLVVFGTETDRKICCSGPETAKTALQVFRKRLYEAEYDRMLKEANIPPRKWQDAVYATYIATSGQASLLTKEMLLSVVEAEKNRIS